MMQATETLWYELCEDVWDKNLVVDMSDIKTTVTSILRWFSHRDLEIPRVHAIRIASRLSKMMQAGDFHHQRYGESPELRVESTGRPKGVLLEDIRHLRSMTPEILESTGGIAGFELNVHGTNGHHPLDKLDYDQVFPQEA